MKLLKITLPIGITLSLVFLVYCFLHTYRLDDAFIIYRYSSNLAHNNGLIFNPGEKIQGSSTPLYTTLLAIPSFFNWDVPAVANSVSILVQGLFALIAWQFLQKYGHKQFSWLVLPLLLLFPHAYRSIGNDRALFYALSLSAIFLYVQKKFTLVTILLALVSLLRLDGFALVLLLTTDYALTYKSLPWKKICLYCLLIAPWYIFAWIYFGSPFPSGLASKYALGGLKDSLGYWEGLWYWLMFYTKQDPLLMVFPIFSFIGLVTHYKEKPWLLVGLWGAISTLLALHAPGSHWYFINLFFTVLITAVLGVGALSDWFDAKLRLSKAGKISLRLCLSIFMIALVAHSFILFTQEKQEGSKSQLYTQIGNWLQSHTETNESVGVTEIGIIPYYSQRKTIDFGGIVQPDIAHHMNPDQAAGVTWAIEHYQPDYVVVPQTWFSDIQMTMKTSNTYTEVKRFSNPQYSCNEVNYFLVNPLDTECHEIIIYQRHD